MASKPTSTASKLCRHVEPKPNSDMDQKGGRGLGEIVKRIDCKMGQPIMYLARDQDGKDGQKKGSITTSPKEVDSIAKKGLECHL